MKAYYNDFKIACYDEKQCLETIKNQMNIFNISDINLIINNDTQNNLSSLDNSLYVNGWNEKDGIDAQCLQSFCEKNDISHYCYDVTNQCVIKNVSKNRNHQSLCYFCINEHMYLIKDETL